MHKKVQTFSRIQKQLISILLSVFCMITAAGLSSVCSHIFKRFSLSCILVFVLFIIPASCSTADRLYGILCSAFAALCLYLRYISPCSQLKTVSTGCLVICKTIITAHHGTITGRNHSGSAQFVFTLP